MSITTTITTSSFEYTLKNTSSSDETYTLGTSGKYLNRNIVIKSAGITQGTVTYTTSAISGTDLGTPGTYVATSSMYINIPEGYYSASYISLDNLLPSFTAPATASYILKDKYAYDEKGQQLAGTIPTYTLNSSYYTTTDSGFGGISAGNYIGSAMYIIAGALAAPTVASPTASAANGSITSGYVFATTTVASGYSTIAITPAIGATTAKISTAGWITAATTAVTAAKNGSTYYLSIANGSASLSSNVVTVGAGYYSTSTKLTVSAITPSASYYTTATSSMISGSGFGAGYVGSTYGVIKGSLSYSHSVTTKVTITVSPSASATATLTMTGTTPTSTTAGQYYSITVTGGSAANSKTVDTGTVSPTFTAGWLASAPSVSLTDVTAAVSASSTTSIYYVAKANITGSSAAGTGSAGSLKVSTNQISAVETAPTSGTYYTLTMAQNTAPSVTITTIKVNATEGYTGALSEQALSVSSKIDASITSKSVYVPQATVTITTPTSTTSSGGTTSYRRVQVNTAGYYAASTALDTLTYFDGTYTAS